MKKIDGRSKAARALRIGAVAAAVAVGGTGATGRQYEPLVMDTQIGGDHYMQKKVQPWDAMEAWMTLEEFVGFLRGNAIKYLARCNDKGGREDIQKAQHYIAKLLEVTQ